MGTGEKKITVKLRFTTLVNMLGAQLKAEKKKNQYFYSKGTPNNYISFPGPCI